MDELFDPDLLGDDPFDVDHQVAHLFRHPHLGLDDVYDAWSSDPLFYPSKPPAHWLMVAEVDGRPLVVPITPSRSGDPTRCRPSAVTWPALSLPRPIEVIEMPSEMTPEDEHEFYADPANQVPTGPPRRRTARLTAPIPVRFPEATMAEIKRRAEADDRSVSSWIRRAVEHELDRSA